MPFPCIALHSLEKHICNITSAKLLSVFYQCELGYWHVTIYS